MDFNSVIQYLPTVISFLFMAVISLITYTYKTEKEEMKKRIEKQEEKTSNIEHNYLERFERMFAAISELKVMQTETKTLLSGLVEEHRRIISSKSCPGQN